MKISSILKILLVVAVCGCERQKFIAPNQSPSESTQEIGNSLEELRKRTDKLIERAKADSSVRGSKEWVEVMDAQGPAYKRQLISCIQKAESITVTEHSDSVDFYEPNRPLPETTPFYEYRTVRLTDDQKAAFLRVVEKMDTSYEKDAKKCGFEPHHRLTFIRNDQKSTSMSVCFTCDEVVWEEAEFGVPKGLIEALRFVVESAGLTPKRDWKTLARTWSEKDVNGNPR